MEGLVCIGLALSMAGPWSANADQDLGSSSFKIGVVPDDDAYGALLSRAEAGDETIDYRELRKAYIESAAFLRASAARAELDRARAEMRSAAKERDDKRVRDAAAEILRIVYIDLDAHKFLRQACAALGDQTCATRHHAVEFGLLRSILASGDASSCRTAWNVVTIEEEYFVLRMQGFALKKQETEPADGRVCDRMEVLDEDGSEKVVYFDATAIFKGYRRALQHQ